MWRNRIALPTCGASSYLCTYARLADRRQERNEGSWQLLSWTKIKLRFISRDAAGCGAFSAKARWRI
ncbi:hypothetical protein KM043_001073 [Ampulex compressa]|nr:hypothetical protein KM043_001073 [Ampulex compressa]